MPPLFKTALVWGLFMGVSSNLRYQVGHRVGKSGTGPQPASRSAPTLCLEGARPLCPSSGSFTRTRCLASTPVAPDLGPHPESRRPPWSPSHVPSAALSPRPALPLAAMLTMS